MVVSEHVLLTGAAGAIGRALAARWVRRAAASRRPLPRLSLVDRDETGLAEAAKLLAAEAPTLDVATYGWDLAELDALPSRLAELEGGRGAVDTLVNNAGFMEMRSLVSMPWELGERLLIVDLLSPLRLMALVAPRLVARRTGRIVNVASMAGVVPLRGCVYYGAAKAGLAMASEIAHAELAPSGVHVVTVYPGPVASPLESRARAQLPSGWLQRALPTGSPDALAAAILDALERRQARVVYPRFYDVASRISPLAARFTARFSPQPLDADPA